MLEQMQGQKWMICCRTMPWRTFQARGSLPPTIRDSALDHLNPPALAMAAAAGSPARSLRRPRNSAIDGQTAGELHSGSEAHGSPAATVGPLAGLPGVEHPSCRGLQRPTWTSPASCARSWQQIRAVSDGARARGTARLVRGRVGDALPRRVASCVGIDGLFCVERVAGLQGLARGHHWSRSSAASWRSINSRHGLGAPGTCSCTPSHCRRSQPSPPAFGCGGGRNLLVRGRRELAGQLRLAVLSLGLQRPLLRAGHNLARVFSVSKGRR